MSWLGSNGYDVVFGMDRHSFQTHYRAGNGVHAAYLDRRRATASSLKRLSFAVNPLHRKILSLEKSTYEGKSLRRLFTNSAMVRDEILSYYTVNPKKISVIHNGVEWSEMGNAFDLWPSERCKLLKRFGVTDESYHFLFVGGGFKRKGLDLLLRALSLLPRRDFVLSVVGADKNLKEFSSLAEDLGIGSNVHFFGARDDVIDFYKVADALVIPSNYDPFANVTVEALAMGVFVVTSKSNGGHEVITSDTGAILEDLYDAEGFAATLAMAMERPKTPSQASAIRNSVKHLDFSHQLDTIVTETLETM